jgi:hypothetical protein
LSKIVFKELDAFYKRMNKTMGHTDKIRSLTEKELVELIKDHRSWNSILYTLGIKYTWYINLIRSRADEFNLDYSHFITTTPGVKPRVYTLDEILVEDPDWKGNNQSLKKRLIKEREWEDKCEMCGLGPEWMGHPLILQLDHINGKNTDNRVENLRILCPNCHSITETFCGKQRKKKFSVKNTRKNICVDCNVEIYRESTRCMECANKNKSIISKKVMTRPSKEQIEKDYETMSWTEIAKTYGVSTSTIKKWYDDYKQIETSKVKNSCIDCGKCIKKESTRCMSCSKLIARKVKDRPTLEQLEKDRETMTWEKIGEKYGVSGRTCGKWLKQYKDQEVTEE